MDNHLLLIFIAVIPVVFILVFVYHNDKTKEPWTLLLQFFGLGILSCGMVLLISYLLGFIFPFMTMNLAEMDMFSILLYSFVGVAFVEEICKWIMVFFRGYRSKEFDEVYDMIVYAVFVSLGFAFVENIIYILGNGNLQTAILRAFSAIPGHACDAVFMGYYLSLAKQCHHRNHYDSEKYNILLSILVPAFLHGIYDFCLFSGIQALLVAFLIFIIFLYVISILKLKELSNAKQEMKKKNRFCPKCGKELENGECKDCEGRQD